MTLDTPAVPNGNGAMAPPRPSAFATKQNDLWVLASNLSGSDLVPQHFRNKPANVFLALQMADRLQLDLFAVMSNLYVVHGTPAFSSKFLIGLANTSGVFKGNLRFAFTGEGDSSAARCEATLRETGEIVAVTVTMAQANAAGWTADKRRKDGGIEPSKYKIMGHQMLAYRAAAFFVRLYCPESTFGGARTVDEVEDMHASGSLTQPEYREATPVRRDPLSLEIQQTTTEVAVAPPREGQEEGESAGAAVDSGSPVSPHAKAIAAFVMLGVPVPVIECEITRAENDGLDAIAHLRMLHKAAKADGARKLLGLLRSERACDMLDEALPADPAAQSATSDLFGDEGGVQHED